jgi:hypothetical protein
MTTAASRTAGSRLRRASVARPNGIGLAAAFPAAHRITYTPAVLDVHRHPLRVLTLLARRSVSSGPTDGSDNNKDDRFGASMILDVGSDYLAVATDLRAALALKRRRRPQVLLPLSGVVGIET